MKTLIVSLISCLLLVSFGALAESGGHAEGKGQHRDNTGLFPQPKADLSRGTPPASPELTAPAFQSKVADTEVALTWNASEGANAYHVQVATDPNFKWLKADEHWVKDTTFQVKDLEKGKHYYWRVAPWRDANKAASNKGSFAVSTFITE